MADADGVLLIDKPAGKTSHDVVAGVRREFPRKTKVGHAGTLDPFATGLLLVLIGRATRAQRFLMALPKTYEVVARLGWRSSTGDPEGEIERGSDPREPLTLPVGRLSQRPPRLQRGEGGGRARVRGGPSRRAARPPGARSGGDALRGALARRRSRRL
jgi:tRNA pseudouridine55 synthase